MRLDGEVWVWGIIKSFLAHSVTGVLPQSPLCGVAFTLWSFSQASTRTWPKHAGAGASEKVRLRVGHPWRKLRGGTGQSLFFSPSPLPSPYKYCFALVLAAL